MAETRSTFTREVLEAVVERMGNDGASRRAVVRSDCGCGASRANSRTDGKEDSTGHFNWSTNTYVGASRAAR